MKEDEEYKDIFEEYKNFFEELKKFVETRQELDEDEIPLPKNGYEEARYKFEKENREECIQLAKEWDKINGQGE